MNALIIDDEEDLCRLLSFQLISLGIPNEFVNTIKDAKKKFSGNTYQLIFLDLNLTDGSGFEMLDYIKTFPKNQTVIVISAYDSERKKVLEHGADHFLPKPFSKKKIAELIQAL
ncbi:response regulator transcription factor [Algoriphagus vanfongensis]|uniref:response regulator transcription factor n=1 Tax=Algoriphagus vanfongensis TaxID=426371 RepID=UPI0004179502|nr:response regulator [Algoriphagus vanfongensis]